MIDNNNNKSLFFVFDRGQAYSPIALQFPVKRICFDKSTMETSWGFQDSKEFKKACLKLYREKVIERKTKIK